MGGVGLLAMLFAIGGGTWVCVRISIGMRATERHSAFTWWVINRLAFLVGAFNLSGFILYFLQARRGYSNAAAAEPTGRLMMFVGISLLVAALPSRWLSDRFGQKRVVATSGLVAGLGTLLLLVSENLGVLYAGGVVVGLATGAFYTANWALGTSLVPRAEAARYLGISNLAGAGAGAVGAYISGPIADHLTVLAPEIPGVGYLTIFALFALLFFASSLALIPIQSPGREHVTSE